MLGRVTKTDERRNARENRPFEIGRRRTNRWPPSRWRILLVMARHALVAVVRVSSPNHTPNERKFIRRLCNLGQVLADIDPGYVRVDRLEWPADLRRSVSFEIEHVLMRRTATEIDHNQGLVPLAQILL